MSPRDEAEAVTLRAEFPAWDVWHGIDGRWHARWPEHHDPEGRPVMVWGSDPADLRDQIRREVARFPRPRLRSEDGGDGE